MSASVGYGSALGSIDELPAAAVSVSSRDIIIVLSSESSDSDDLSSAGCKPVPQNEQNVAFGEISESHSGQRSIVLPAI
jgi:hypothetical protein